MEQRAIRLYQTLPKEYLRIKHFNESWKSISIYVLVYLTSDDWWLVVMWEFVRFERTWPLNVLTDILGGDRLF